jgi:hypothetical protein
LKYLGNVIATKMLLEQRLRVRLMYRNKPSNHDSGWHFLCGLEEQEYLDNPKNLVICDINTILEIDPEVELHLIAPPGSAFMQVARGWSSVSHPRNHVLEGCCE